MHVLEYYSSKQKRVTRSTLGAETRALADAVDIGKVICVAVTELKFGPLTTDQARDLELHGFTSVRLEASTDARSLFDALKSEDSRTPTEVSMVFDLSALREALTIRRIHRIWWVDTRDMLADALTKGIINRAALLEYARTGQWVLVHQALSYVAPYRQLAAE